jgi:hypothetical protein
LFFSLESIIESVLFSFALEAELAVDVAACTALLLGIHQPFFFFFFLLQMKIFAYFELSRIARQRRSADMATVALPTDYRARLLNQSNFPAVVRCSEKQKKKKTQTKELFNTSPEEASPWLQHSQVPFQSPRVCLQWRSPGLETQSE